MKAFKNLCIYVRYKCSTVSKIYLLEVTCEYGSLGNKKVN